MNSNGLRSEKLVDELTLPELDKRILALKKQAERARERPGATTLIATSGQSMSSRSALIQSSVHAVEECVLRPCPRVAETRAGHAATAAMSRYYGDESGCHADVQCLAPSDKVQLELDMRNRAVHLRAGSSSFERGSSAVPRTTGDWSSSRKFPLMLPLQ